MRALYSESTPRERNFLELFHHYLRCYCLLCYRHLLAIPLHYKENSKNRLFVKGCDYIISFLNFFIVSFILEKRSKMALFN
jgi:hypothetical protein